MLFVINFDEKDMGNGFVAVASNMHFIALALLRLGVFLSK